MRVRRGPLIGGAVVAVGVYALLWIGYTQDWAWLTRIDVAALDLAYRFGEVRASWVSAWDVFCTVLGPGAFRLVTLVVIVVALVRRRVRLAVFLLMTVELSAVVTEVAKFAAGRSRPDTAMVSALSTSFPSGHALGVLVAVAALLTVARSRPVWLVVLGVVVVLTIGVGRVVLNVHHPSDVIAGWALGYAYFVVCLLLVPPRRPVTEPDETPVALDSAR